MYFPKFHLKKSPSFLGKLLYKIFPYRKKVIINNLSKCFPNQLSMQQQKHFIQLYYTHLVKCFYEILKSFFCTIKASLINEEYLKELLRQDRPFFILTGHIGNWEVFPITLTSQVPELQNHISIIRKPINKRWLQQFLFGRFKRAGFQVIEKDSASKQINQCLRKKGHALTFVLDQHACLSIDGITSSFMGVPAGTYKSLALLAVKTGAPVLPCYSYRENNKHIIKFLSPIILSEKTSLKKDIQRMTDLYNKTLEQIILEHPEQWIWSHQRWKI